MSTFIVTGASSGIGRAVAAALAGRGVDVLAVARRAELLDDLQRSAGPRLHAHALDLATDQGIDDLIAAAETHASVDGIVHAAGSLITPAVYRELDASALTQHFHIHVATPIEINNRLGNLMRRGRMIYIDSYSASDPRLGWTGYSIIKSAAQMAARAAAAEVDDHRVIRVFPGGVRTELVVAVVDSPTASPTRDIFTDMVTSGTIIEPDVIGRYIATIALDATDEQLDAREFWDFSDPTSHI